MFSLLMVDDHLMLLESVRLALEAQPDISSVEVECSVEGALAQVAMSSPDVVVADYRIGKKTGADLTRTLLTRDPDTTVVIVSGHASPLIVDDCIAAGCAAFVQKRDGIAELLTAIRMVRGGLTHFPHRSTPTHATNVVAEQTALSPRELEILQLLSEGLAPKSIANRLVISVHTVRSHVGQIRRKLGVTNQLAAVARASSAGLIAGPDAGT